MRLRDLSVRSKLLLIVMVSSMVAIGILSLVLIADHTIHTREGLERQLQMLADILGDRSTAALSFDDPQTAHENLSALAHHPSIVGACIFDAEPRLFASFERDIPSEAWDCPEFPPTDGSRFIRGDLTHRALILTRPIALEGHRIGTIVLYSTTDEIRQQLLHYGTVALLSILLAAGASWLVFTRLHRIVSDPILKLAETSRAISEHQDYSVRVQGQSHDEVGALIDAFNTMLATIQEQSSRLVQANEDLGATVAELESKNTELERFTYTVSHDLKSPLVTIKGFVGMAQKDAAAGNQARLERDFATIQRATDTMAALLDDVLELSRVGRVVGDRQCVKFRNLADEAVALLAGRLAESGAQVTLGRLDTWVEVDTRRIVEVLQNLIENGIKFSPGGVPHIEVGSRPASRDDPHPVFFVADQGLGIDAAYHSKVFDIFERLDVDIPGTGIGLAIVRRIVEMHHGKIWVESEGRGHGSTFCFTLPPCDDGTTK